MVIVAILHPQQYNKPTRSLPKLSQQLQVLPALTPLPTPRQVEVTGSSTMLKLNKTLLPVMCITKLTNRIIRDSRAQPSPCQEPDQVLALTMMWYVPVHVQFECMTCMSEGSMGMG